MEDRPTESFRILRGVKLSEEATVMRFERAEAKRKRRLEAVKKERDALRACGEGALLSERMLLRLNGVCQSLAHCVEHTQAHIELAQIRICLPMYILTFVHVCMSCLPVCM